MMSRVNVCCLTWTNVSVPQGWQSLLRSKCECWLPRECPLKLPALCLRPEDRSPTERLFQLKLTVAASFFQLYTITPLPCSTLYNRHTDLLGCWGFSMLVHSSLHPSLYQCIQPFFIPLPFQLSQVVHRCDRDITLCFFIDNVSVFTSSVFSVSF